MTEQPHCEHECVCYIYAGVGQSCFESGCEYDTRRSRPAPAPDSITLTAYQWKVTIEATRAQAAAQAREQVLKEVHMHMVKSMTGVLKKDIWKNWNETMDFIQSLRSTKPQEMTER